MNSLLSVVGIGSIGVFWSQFVGIFSRIRALIIVEARFPDPGDGSAILHYLGKNAKELDLGDKRYTWNTKFVRRLDRTGFVPYELQGDIQIFLHGWRPIIVSLKRDPNRSTETCISFIRGTFSMKKLFIDATLLWDKENHEFPKENVRFCIKRFFGKAISRDGSSANYNSEVHKSEAPSSSSDSLKPMHYRKDEIGLRIENKPFERLAYSESVKEFEKEVRRWKTSEKWFKERGLPWRFGGGLFGPPGTGKTSYVRAIAQDLDMPIHSYDLTGMSNEELVENWSQSVDCAPCVVLFEDMDRIFDQDKKIKSVEGKSPITMDCLLNCISGVQSADGILVLVTANDLSKLDSALGIPDETGRSTRPGRLDRAVWFGELEEKGRYQIAKRILAGYENLIERAVKEGINETGAQFESRCSKLALECYWNDKNVGDKV